MTELKVGVVGTGMGRIHMEEFAKIKGVSVAGVCDLNLKEAQLFADKFGAKIVRGDYRDFVREPSFDAISIAVPNRLHASIAIAALEAGKHVLCEKPMATTVEDALRMVSAAERAGKLLMINQSQRFNKGTQIIRRYAEQGDLGRIYLGIATWIRRKGWPVLNMGPDGVMGRGEWFIRKDAAGGGALFDIGVHLLDLAWYLMGSPRPVSASAASFLEVARERLAQRNLPAEVDELTSALLRFENGAVIQLVVSWDSHNAPDHSVRIFGSEAGAGVFPPVLYRGSEVIETAALDVVEGGLCMPTAYEHFVSCLREPACRMIASGRELLDVIRMLKAIQESAVAGKEVAVRSDPRGK
ncbi:MAG: Gfo/Idh/MocA family oxidoreductase [Planctomycetota bacterium]